MKTQTRMRQEGIIFKYFTIELVCPFICITMATPRYKSVIRTHITTQSLYKHGVEYCLFHLTLIILTIVKATDVTKEMTVVLRVMTTTKTSASITQTNLPSTKYLPTSLPIHTRTELIPVRRSATDKLNRNGAKEFTTSESTLLLRNQICAELRAVVRRPNDVIPTADSIEYVLFSHLAYSQSISLLDYSQ